MWPLWSRKRCTLCARTGEDPRIAEHGYSRMLCDALAKVFGREDGRVDTGGRPHPVTFATLEEVPTGHGEFGSLEGDGYF